MRPEGPYLDRQEAGTGKRPYAIALADRRLMALAGLWETWPPPAGERVRSFAIIPTTPNEMCAAIHNRMPVILKPEWPAWPGEEPADIAPPQDLLGPHPAEMMMCWPVSQRLGMSKITTQAWSSRLLWVKNQSW
jgi:putative SOS response-associated peptidase YedK